MTKDLLWEVGVEEIPARFLPPAIKQMEQLARDAFAAAGLGYQQLHVYATPRRLALTVDALEEKAADIASEVKGPAKKAAYDQEGRPTRALEGFCRGQGVTTADLFEQELNGNTYLYARKQSIGQPAMELLPELLLTVVEKLYFPKPMRWGYNTLRFARPIRWLVALFGQEVVDVEFGGVKAGRYSRGHRLLGSDHIEISEPAQYQELLRQNYVIVDQDERREQCRQQIAAVAASCGGQVKEDEELLTEVTYLLEYPTALSGCFEDKYLAIPEELVTTPMVDQQRYFPVYGPDGKLINRFITVRNGDDRYLNIVAEGNEKVLRARLADAEFFYTEDLQDKMDDKVEELSAVVFHEKLGTMRQKVERIVRLSEFIATRLGYTPQELIQTSRAAYLAKADLGSRVVYEFPELQGIIGEYYALAAGEDAVVAQAIREHYLPRFSGDELPESKPGIAVALADKLDSLAGFFAMGMIPSGSQDPYALRRAAAGCANIIFRRSLDIRITEILPYAFELLKKDAPALDWAGLEEKGAKVVAFLNQRVENILAEEGVGYDIVNAINASVAASEGNITGLVRRAQALQSYRAQRGFTELLAAMNRIGNILRSADDESAGVEPSLFTDQSEQALFDQIEQREAGAAALLEAGEFEQALALLAELAPYIAKFFEAVMVMDKDPALRRNRQALLRRILSLALQIGDFGKIVE